MKILYADDDPEDRDIFQAVVAEINAAIDVILVDDGPSALEALNSMRDVPDAIFLDVNMPRMTGIECVAILRQQERFKDAPIILYSTTTSELEAYKGMKAGATRFLTKAHTYMATLNVLRAALAALQ
jgi:CheY-like chemotaxis protein